MYLKWKKIRCFWKYNRKNKDFNMWFDTNKVTIHTIYYLMIFGVSLTNQCLIIIILVLYITLNKVSCLVCFYIHKNEKPTTTTYMYNIKSSIAIDYHTTQLYTFQLHIILNIFKHLTYCFISILHQMISVFKFLFKYFININLIYFIIWNTIAFV